MNSPVLPSGPVVVGVDASASARDAAEWAADLAAVWDAPLRLVHVVHGWPEGGRLPASSPWLRELVDAADRIGVRDVDAAVIRGGLVDTLLERTADARLLVLGSYGEAAWTGALAGSLAAVVIDRARCPVAVVRGRAPELPPPRGGPVVVGVDGSDAGAAALDLAAELAVAIGARLVALHATADAAVAPAQAQVAAVRIRYPSLSVDERLVDGTAARRLGEQADARLLVIGRHHVGPEVVDPLGSVVRNLIENVPCPVLVAAQPQRSLSDAPADASSFGSSHPPRTG